MKKSSPLDVFVEVKLIMPPECVESIVYFIIDATLESIYEFKTFPRILEIWRISAVILLWDREKVGLPNIGDRPRMI